MTARTIEEYQLYWKNELLAASNWHPSTETMHTDSFEFAHQVVVAIEPNLADDTVEVTFYDEELNVDTGEYGGAVMAFTPDDIDELIEKLLKVRAVLLQANKSGNEES